MARLEASPCQRRDCGHRTRGRCHADHRRARRCGVLQEVMPLFSFEGLAPRVDDSAFVAPTATLVGDVIIEAGASVWYGAVIRADYAPVIVRAGANVQDNAVVHGAPGLTTDVGAG